MPGNFRLVRCELGFTTAIFLATFALVIFCQDTAPNLPHLPFQAGWALVVTLASYVVLDAVKFLDSFRTRPSRTDLLTLYLTLLVPFTILKHVYFMFTGLTILRYREIFIGLVFVALAGWTYRYLAGLMFEKSGEKRTLWLLLDGAETVELKSEFKDSGLSAFYNLNGNSDRSDLVVISRVGSGHFENSPDLLLAHLNGVPVRDVRHLLAEIRGRESLDFLNLWFFLLTATPQRRIFRFFFRLKSVSEPLLAAFILLWLSPLVFLTAAAVKLTSSGPVFYRQKRLGYKGKEFELVKFRSMVEHAEKEGPAWAGQQTTKLTAIGNFLRRSHFDELPQLWNVIKGEMSFVGPRPERPEYYAILKEHIPLFWMRTLVRPGITGWAQVMSGYASSVEESREKLEYDLYYMKRMSPVMDLKILVRTFLMLLNAKDDLAL